MWPFKRKPKPTEPVWHPQRVYLLWNAQTRLYKIGISDNVERRKRELERQGGVPITIMGSWQAERPEDIERALHRYYAAKRREGEWFALADQDVYAISHALTGW
jgi:predicted GIY-YIG superfamily endonuclease